MNAQCPSILSYHPTFTLQPCPTPCWSPVACSPSHGCSFLGLINTDLSLGPFEGPERGLHSLAWVFSPDHCRMIGGWSPQLYFISPLLQNIWGYFIPSGIFQTPKEQSQLPVIQPRAAAAPKTKALNVTKG